MTESINTTPPDRSTRRRKFLLVVDSDVTNLFYTSMLLQRFEYHICTVQSAEDALEMATVSLPALVVADLALNGMNGLELVRRLRQEPRTAAVPVIVQSGEHSPEIEQQCRQAGAMVCLRKPVQAEELYRFVQAGIEPKPRANIRIQTRLPVTVNHKPLECIEGECVTVLSEHGMYVRTLKPSPKGTRLTVQIPLNDQIVSVIAVVLYSHNFGEGPFGEPGMGLQFVQITPQDQERVRLFIRDMIMQGLKPI